MKNKLVLFLKLIIVENYYRMKKLLFTILTILLLLIIAENFHWYTRVFLEGPDNKVITIFRPLSIWQSGNYFYLIPYKYTNIFAPSNDYYIRPIRLGRDDIDDFALDWGNSANDKIVIYDDCIVNKLKSAVIGDYHNLNDKQKENLFGYDLTYTVSYNSNAGWGMGVFIFLLFYPILAVLILLALFGFLINTVSILIAMVRDKKKEF